VANTLFHKVEIGGRRMTVRYIMNDKCAPFYACNWRKRQGVTHSLCFSFKASVTDPIIEKKVVAVLTPANLSIAINALNQFEKHNTTLNKQGEMNIQRCQYQADLAQRSFEQLDPANRLVAASLEKSWNLELEKLAIAEKEHRDYMAKQEKEFPACRKKRA